MTLTVKQEKFAQAYIELGNAAEAYRRAYDAENMKPITIRRKAAELLENGNVAARVRALQEIHLERHMVTIDSITQELDESRKLATADKQHSAAISATLGKAKIHGLIVDKIAGDKGSDPIQMQVTVTAAEAKAIKKALDEEF